MGLEIPLSEELTAELFEFWGEIFGNQPDLTKGVLLVEEQDYNRNTLYLTKLSDKQAAYLGLDSAGPFKSDHYRY